MKSFRGRLSVRNCANVPPEEPTGQWPMSRALLPLPWTRINSSSLQNVPSIITTSESASRWTSSSSNRDTAGKNAIDFPDEEVTNTPTLASLSTKPSVATPFPAFWKVAPVAYAGYRPESAITSHRNPVARSPSINSKDDPGAIDFHDT